MIARHFNDPNTIPRRIMVTLIAIVIVSIGTVAALTYWMTVETNKLAQNNARSMIDNAVVAQRDTLQALTSDYAQWGEFYDWIQVGDQEAIDSNVGSGVTESETFDLITVVDRHGVELYHYTLQTENDGIHVDHGSISLRAASLLDGAPAGDTETITWFDRVNGEIMLLAVEHIVPDDIADPMANFPILVTGRMLGSAALEGIGNQLLITGIVKTDMLPMNAPNVILHDAFGQVVTYLTWESPRPGDVLLLRAIPLIVALSMALLIAAILVGYGSSRQTRAFLKERIVARTDHLTGVINRTGLDNIVADEGVATALHRGHAALVYLDLNEFKQLNDTAGHQAGDLALRITAEKLMQSVRQSDFVARLGGDEFVCLLIDKDAKTIAQTVVSRILQRTRKTIDFGHDNIAVKPSIGVAIAEPGSTWAELLQQADTAMYCAKETKQDRAVFFHDQMISDTLKLAS